MIIIILSIGVFILISWMQNTGKMLNLIDLISFKDSILSLLPKELVLDWRNVPIPVFEKLADLHIINRPVVIENYIDEYLISMYSVIILTLIFSFVKIFKKNIIINILNISLLYFILTFIALLIYFTVVNFFAIIEFIVGIFLFYIFAKALENFGVKRVKVAK